MANSGSRRERRQQKKLAKKSGDGQADIGAVLEGALADQQAGRLDEAEQAYARPFPKTPRPSSPTST